MNNDLVNCNNPTAEHLVLAMEKWGVGNNSLKFIRGNENWVYELDDRIFRFTRKDHRSRGEIQAEIDWIIYLSNQGLSVSIPLKSKQNHFIEKISDFWNCTVFRKAPGILLKEKRHFKKEVFLSWGKSIGLMHKATGSFSPGKNKRKTWNKDDGYLLSQQALLSSDPSNPITIQYLNLLKKIDSYPKDRKYYGLIHGDFHHGNFHYNSKSNQITLFDFDDCHYSWFAFDIAVPFASLELSTYLRGLNVDYKAFQHYFLEGYHKEYSLDSFWLDQIPLFMNYRFASLYFWFKGRAMKNRITIGFPTRDFMNICEILTLENKPKLCL